MAGSRLGFRSLSLLHGTIFYPSIEDTFWIASAAIEMEEERVLAAVSSLLYIERLRASNHKRTKFICLTNAFILHFNY